MKKTILAFFCASLLVMVSSSCQKEEMEPTNHAWTAPGNWSKNTFSASFASDNGKTSIENYKVVWNQNDQIRIANGDGAVIYSVTNINNTGTSATFSVPEGSTEIGEGPYVATYPHTFDGSTITLPQVQRYDADKGIVDFPMYAASDSRSLDFKNMCGVLELTMQKANIRIKHIFITTDKPITGNFNVGIDNGFKCIKSSDASGSNNNSVLLDCGNGVDISSSKKFYIYLPLATFNSKFDIEIVTNGNATYTLHKVDNRSMTFDRNRVKTISITNPTFKKAPELGGYGLYSVSANQRVYFAHGNLFYKLACQHDGWYYSNGWRNRTITDTVAYWGFYEKQYGGWQMGAQFDEFTPNNNGTYSNYAQTNTQTQTYSDRLSYFTWGYNSNYSTTYNSQPDANFNATTNKPNNNWEEWTDYITIEGAGEANQYWRTLTSTEWRYLLHTRTMFFGAPRFIHAKLVGVPKLYDDNNSQHGETVTVKGLLLFPDRYPTDDRANHPYSLDDANHWMSISASDWEKMEKAGCVFLPATGYRMGVDIKAHGTTTDMYGLYLSSSKLQQGDPYFTSPANHQSTHTAGLLWGVSQTSTGYPDLIGDLSNSCAHNVRLVMDESHGQTETSSPEYPII